MVEFTGYGKRLYVISTLTLVITVSCGKSSFFQNQPEAKNKPGPESEAPQKELQSLDVKPAPPPAVVAKSVGTQPPAPTTAAERRSCSQTYTVPATANPYLAGMAAGTTITYHGGQIDVAPAQSPILVTPSDPDCLKVGSTLYFKVSGLIAHRAQMEPVGPDGRTDRPEASEHQLGPKFGKSHIKAPLTSMLAVFLGPDDPSTASAPELLDFSSKEQRNQLSLSPKVGQIFFVGDGKTDAGDMQKFIVPEGATRLYLAIMDAYEWNNNLGEFSSSIEGESL